MLCNLPLVIIFTVANLAIAVRVARSFLAQVPVEMVEATAMDGGGIARTPCCVLAPVAIPGRSLGAIK